MAEHPTPDMPVDPSAGADACLILDKIGWKRRDGCWESPPEGGLQHGYGVAPIGKDEIDLGTIDTTQHGAMVRWLNANGIPAANVGWSIKLVQSEFARRAAGKVEVVEVTARAAA